MSPQRLTARDAGWRETPYPLPLHEPVIACRRRSDTPGQRLAGLSDAGAAHGASTDHEDHHREASDTPTVASIGSPPGQDDRSSDQFTACVHCMALACLPASSYPIISKIGVPGVLGVPLERSLNVSASFGNTYFGAPEHLRSRCSRRRRESPEIRYDDPNSRDAEHVTASDQRHVRSRPDRSSYAENARLRPLIPARPDVPQRFRRGDVACYPPHQSRRRVSLHESARAGFGRRRVRRAASCV